MAFATPSNGMEVVLSHPQVSHPTSLAGMIHQTLLMTKEQDHLSIRLKYLTIQIVGKTLTAHMLSGNFTTDRVTTLKNEANSIELSAFLPQRTACMVEQICMRDMIANTENSMVVLGAHKSKVETSGKYPTSSHMGMWNSHEGTLPLHTCRQANGTLL